MFSIAVWSAAERPGKSVQPTWIGAGLLAVLLVFVLIKAYRVWEEINDVEEPDSAADLLASFQQAHAAGELDDAELERVKEQLHRASTSEERTSSNPRPEAATPQLDPSRPIGQPGAYPSEEEGSRARA
jgi:hypothetical protein